MIIAKRFYENLGLAWPPQYTKLRATSWARITEIVTHDSSGRSQPMTCIDVRTALMSLATIHEGKVSPEIRLTA